tara:strand:+ start:51726 stop:54467 length:2742 start_codon:yes stop_codon:yes gene_type:complete
MFMDYLFHNFDGQHQIITEERFLEIQLGAMLHEGADVGRCALELNPSDPTIVYYLIDKYLHEIRRHKKAGVNHRADIEVIKQAIGIVKPAWGFYSKEQLAAELKVFEVANRRYYGSELSDDSDVDDEQVHLTKDSFNSIREAQATQKFWQSTKRTSARTGNIVHKLTDLKKQCEDGTITVDATIASNIDKIESTTFGEKKGFAEIPYADMGAALTTDEEALRIRVNDRLKSLRSGDLAAEETLIKACQAELEQTKFFVVQYRGLNYLHARWNASSRRYHYRMDERHARQYCEMVLKTLEFDFYTQLNKNNDYIRNPALRKKLKDRSDVIKRFMLDLRSNYKYCVDYSDKSKKNPYLFNNILERLQHAYSNGIDDFLVELSSLKQQHPDFWKRFPNAFNPFNSTGNSAYHALKYAYGMKDYYNPDHPPSLRWQADGALEYLHVGKVYLSLHRLEDMLYLDLANNLPQMDREGRVALQRDIGPEKEMSFLSFIDSDDMFHQYVAKFPDFSHNHMAVHEFKYGLNKTLYDLFKFFIIRSSPHSASRVAITALLKEWLCAYHTILLMRQAFQEARRRGGKLIFIGEDGLLSAKPNMSLWTGGETNVDRRRDTHVHRENRRSMATSLGQHKRATQPTSGFYLVSDLNITTAMRRVNTNSIATVLVSKKKVPTTPQQVSSALTSFDSRHSSGSGGERVSSALRAMQADGQCYDDAQLVDLVNHYWQNNPNVVFDDYVYIPLVHSPSEHPQQMFIEAINTALTKPNQITVLVINTTAETVSNLEYDEVHGTHWLGVVVRLQQGQIYIELFDSANNDADYAGTLAAYVQPGVQTAISRIIQLLSAKIHGQVMIRVLHTEQQAGDADCGVWLVDNINRRVQNLPLRVNNALQPGNALAVSSGQLRAEQAPFVQGKDVRKFVL